MTFPPNMEDLTTIGHIDIPLAKYSIPKHLLNIYIFAGGKIELSLKIISQTICSKRIKIEA